MSKKGSVVFDLTGEEEEKKNPYFKQEDDDKDVKSSCRPSYKTNDEDESSHDSIQEEKDEDAHDSGHLGGKKRTGWTNKEKARLTRLVEEHGQNFELIQTYFTKPKRSAQACYLYWTRRIKNQDHVSGKSRNKWTDEEKDKLAELVGKYGKDWQEIQKHFTNPNRTATACMQSWFKFCGGEDLDRKSNKEQKYADWTPQEKLKFRKFHCCSFIVHYEKYIFQGLTLWLLN